MYRVYMVKYNGVIATLTFASGEVMENIPVSVKEFSTGTKGYFAQIPKTVIDGEEINGQIQIWKVGSKPKKA